MSEETALTPTIEQRTKLSISESLAHDYGMEPGPFMEALVKVVFPATDRKGNPPSNAQVIAYMAVCKRYGLDPFTKMLWPFPMKDGGFQPATSFDGWLYILNNHPRYAGDEYEEEFDDKGNLIAGTVTIYRNDRDRPIKKRCKRSEWDTESPNWKSMPSHMLELRTYCQGIRKAFGIGGIYEADELARMDEATNITGESKVLERSTETKKEALKEKIGAKKKDKDASEGAGSEASEGATAEISPEQPQSPAPTQEQPQIGDEGLPWDDDAPPPEQKAEPKPDRPVTEDERNQILDVLKAKATSKAKKDKVQEAFLEKFKELGVSNSRELPFSQFDAVLEWAKNLEV